MTRIPNQTRKRNKDRDELGKKINVNPNSNSDINKTPKSTKILIREKYKSKSIKDVIYCFPTCLRDLPLKIDIIIDLDLLQTSR